MYLGLPVLRSIRREYLLLCSIRRTDNQCTKRRVPCKCLSRIQLLYRHDSANSLAFQLPTWREGARCVQRTLCPSGSATFHPCQIWLEYRLQSSGHHEGEGQKCREVLLSGIQQGPSKTSLPSHCAWSVHVTCVGNGICSMSIMVQRCPRVHFPWPAKYSDPTRSDPPITSKILTRHDQLVITAKFIFEIQY